MTINLPNFHQSNVLVVGDVMLDQYWYGSTNRISREAPVPIVKIDNIEERPGGAANVAMNIASLGAHSHLIGLTGVDDAASTLGKKLNEVNITYDFVAVDTHPTITKLRVLSHHKQIIRLDFEQSFENIDTAPILEYIKIALSTSGVLVLSDYAKGALKRVREIIMLARAINVPVLVDPKGADFARYRGATLLTPNLSELEEVVGPCQSEAILINRGMSIISTYELLALLITRSEQGMTLLQPGKKPLHLPTDAKEVYDVTGAGDTVISVLAAALSAGNSLEESCFLANAAAGVAVGKLGTSTVSLGELEEVILSHTNTGFGIISEEELKKAVALACQRGEKVVMTNGIFDILHAGHVSYLTNARKLGDRLIVAVNSDASTKRLKGENRPITPLVQRMTVLAALEAVDWVVSFSEDTPQRLIANVLPNLLVKGGDYQLHEIAGSQEVLANGGDVQILNFENNYSTTNIINTIKNSKNMLSFKR